MGGRKLPPQKEEREKEEEREKREKERQREDLEGSIALWCKGSVIIT